MKGIMKDALILFVITLISGICLGAVHELTKAPIAAAKMASNLATYQEIFPEADNFDEPEDLQDQAAASYEEIAAQGYGNVTVDAVQRALDSSGNVIGYLVAATSGDGYGGDVSVSVGIRSDDTLAGIGFLSIGETPGLGMKATEPEFKDQFIGKPIGTYTVTKSGSPSDSEVQAISGASFTSGAVTGAVNAAMYFYQNCMSQ